MGVQIKVGKFEATLPAVHTLPVRDIMLVVSASEAEQPFIMSHIIMSKLTYLQRKKFDSLTMDEYAEVLKQWMGIKGENK